MFAAWFRQFILDHKIKRMHLYKITGFHPNNVYWWLEGRNMPNAYSLIVLATALSKETGIARPELLEKMAEAILKDGPATSKKGKK